jgi:hypothetical protein
MHPRDVDPKVLFQMKRPCFACLERESTKMFRLRPPAEWPAPIEKGTAFAICDQCTIEQLAEAVRDHINNLRVAENTAIERRN